MTSLMRPLSCYRSTIPNVDAVVVDEANIACFVEIEIRVGRMLVVENFAGFFYLGGGHTGVLVVTAGFPRCCCPDSTLLVIWHECVRLRVYHNDAGALVVDWTARDTSTTWSHIRKTTGVRDEADHLSHTSS